jgi:hypothetical protein
VTNNIFTLASEIRDLRSKWQTLSIYERFEQTVVTVLTLVIAIIVAVATWQLLLHTLKLAGNHLVNPAAHRAGIQAHPAGSQAPSPRYRSGEGRGIDRTVSSGSAIHHS